ncbi:MAG TPA: phenylalanine--tRNA ligase subunit beta [Chthoniobacteraceae bacterium]
MKISLNWLREYVDFTGGAEALAELLTMAGVEVEGIQTKGAAIDHVVVAQIRESVQHPNADRLSVCQVDDGSGTARQIVCGAKNYKVGDKVPLALPGAVLPGDFKIKVGKLRGVESQGMLCSADELGLPKGEDGLLLLPAESRVGAPLSELFPSDTVLDLEVTPNRPDLLSHIGVAREVAALTGLELKVRRERKAELNFAHPVQISAEECPIYTARLISNVQVGPSPAWLREKLEAVGLRSINNIVDITNFVMLEMGQPLHAFDAAKLSGDLQVRDAQPGEKFLALDGRTYPLTADHMVIADGARAVALAGVMGGEETGVTTATKEIWLESAYFLPSSIRRTSRGLGLLSDSSYRFEREVDPAGVLVASQRATELIVETAGGQPGELRIGLAANSQFGFDAKGAVEGIEYTNTVRLRPERCEAVLGIDITEDEIAQVLTGFGLRKSETGWEIPSFRPDLQREADLIEEVARVVGIEAIPARHVARFGPSSPSDAKHDRLMVLRRALASFGLHESRTLSLVSERALKYHLGGAELRRLRNPLTEDHAILRPSLLPGLIDSLARNARAGEKIIRLFEVGRVFAAAEPEEISHLGVILAGPTSAANWRGGVIREHDLFDLEGILDGVLGGKTRFVPVGKNPVGFTVAIEIDGRNVGFAGQLWPNEARALDVSGAAVFAEVDLTGWLNSAAGAKAYREIPRFPAVTRDIAIIAPIQLTHGRVWTVLQAAKEPLLAEVELFDLFSDPSGQKIPADKKSLAYSLTYRTGERTLTADEVNAAHARLKDRLKSELGVQFRE